MYHKVMQMNFCNEWRNVLSKWIIMSHSFWMNFPWRSSMTWMLFSQTKQIISDTSSTKITDGHWNHYSSVVASSPALLWPLIKQQPASSLFCPQQSRRRTACWWFSAWGASPWVGWVNVASNLLAEEVRQVRVTCRPGAEEVHRGMV